MSSLNIYLTFDGACEQAFNFYTEVFDAQVNVLSRFSEMPPNPEFELADEDRGKIMHMTLQIDENTILMGSDTPAGAGIELVTGNNFSIAVAAGTRQRVDEILARLSEDGQVTMPTQETFWGAYFGSCVDRFGINWMVSCEVNSQEVT